MQRYPSRRRRQKRTRRARKNRYSRRYRGGAPTDIDVQREGVLDLLDTLGKREKYETLVNDSDDFVRLAYTTYMEFCGRHVELWEIMLAELTYDTPMVYLRGRDQDEYSSGEAYNMFIAELLRNRSNTYLEQYLSGIVMPELSDYDDVTDSFIHCLQAMEEWVRADDRQSITIYFTARMPYPGETRLASEVLALYDRILNADAVMNVNISTPDLFELRDHFHLDGKHFANITMNVAVIERNRWRDLQAFLETANVDSLTIHAYPFENRRTLNEETIAWLWNLNDHWSGVVHTNRDFDVIYPELADHLAEITRNLLSLGVGLH